jgi:hypothetical protein
MILYATRHQSKLYKLDTETRVLITDIHCDTLTETVPKDKLESVVVGMTKYSTLLGEENYKQKLELLKR